MTSAGLRALYKKDTGLYADVLITKDITVDPETTLSELEDPIEFELDVDFDDFPYIDWLEEYIINNIKK